MKIKKSRKLALLLTLVLTALMVITSCSSGGSDTSGGSGSADTATTEGGEVQLVVASATEPRSLDPAHNYEYATFHVVNSINDGLLRFTADAELEPWLAESWEAVDSLTYVYQIRQGVKFSDGSDLTVDDVIFSLERLRDPDLASDVNRMYASVDTIEQTGDWEVTVKLSQPDAMWQYAPATPGGQIVSKAFVEAAGESFGKSDGGTLGTGAYKLESWQPGSQFVLTRNEYYWNEEAGVDIDTVVINIIPDANSIQLALESGQADFAIIGTKETLDAFDGSDSINVISSPSLNNTVLSFNTQKAPFDDVNVRKAVAYAVDSVGIRESLLGDYAFDAGDLPFGEAGYILGDAKLWTDSNKTLPDYSYNIEKAKEYLAQSDYPDGFSTTLYYMQDPTYNSLCQAIQASLKQIGIEVELLQVQSSEYYALAYGGKITDGVRDFDMGINRWNPDYPDPAGHLTPQYWSENAGAGGSNFAAYSNPDVDALIDAQLQSTDNDERADLLREAFAIAAEDVPYKYLYYQSNNLVLNNKFDYELSVIWIFNLDYKDVKAA